MQFLCRVIGYYSNVIIIGTISTHYRLKNNIKNVIKKKLFEIDFIQNSY